MNNRTAMVRIYSIHNEIASERYPNVPALMAVLETSESTIRLDLQVMRDQLGAPLLYNRRRNGYAYEGSFELPRLVLTDEEMESLWVAQEWL